MESYVGDGGVGGEGEGREQADTMDYSSDSVLGKLQYQVNDSHRVGLTTEWMNGRSKSGLESEHGYTVKNGPHRRTYDNQSSDDETERKRVSFSHQYLSDSLMFDDMNWSVTWQESTTAQNTKEHYVGEIEIPVIGGVTADENRIKV